MMIINITWNSNEGGTKFYHFFVTVLVCPSMSLRCHNKKYHKMLQVCPNFITCLHSNNRYTTVSVGVVCTLINFRRKMWNRVIICHNTGANKVQLWIFAFLLAAALDDDCNLMNISHELSCNSISCSIFTYLNIRCPKYKLPNYYVVNVCILRVNAGNWMS